MSQNLERKYRGALRVVPLRQEMQALQKAISEKSQTSLKPQWHLTSKERKAEREAEREAGVSLRKRITEFNKKLDLLANDKLKAEWHSWEATREKPVKKPIVTSKYAAQKSKGRSRAFPSEIKGVCSVCEGISSRHVCGGCRARVEELRQQALVNAYIAEREGFVCPRSPLRPFKLTTPEIETEVENLLYAMPDLKSLVSREIPYWLVAEKGKGYNLQNALVFKYWLVAITKALKVCYLKERQALTILDSYRAGNTLPLESFLGMWELHCDYSEADDV